MGNFRDLLGCRLIMVASAGLAATLLPAAVQAQMDVTIGQNADLEKSVETYKTGTTTWAEFSGDGWFEKAPTTTSFGLIKAVGKLDDMLMVVVATYAGDVSGFADRAEQERPLALGTISSGEEVNYDPGYITTSSDLQRDIPSSCILRFEKGKLIQKRCLF